MLAIAKKKAKQIKQKIPFYKADMRTVQLGQFDAVLSIFNAVGHLTRIDFEQAMSTVSKNLKSGGLYLFDIYNLEYFLAGDNITKLTVDWLEYCNDKVERFIQYSTIDADGILASYTTALTYEHGKLVFNKKLFQTLQIYRIAELRQMLKRTGFTILEQTDIQGSFFVEKESETLLIVAQKQ